MSSSPPAGHAPRPPWRGHGRVLALLGALTLLSWIYLGYMARAMHDPTAGMRGMPMPGMGPAEPAAWRGVDVAADAVMWAVMMAAMMLPSVAPTVLLFAAVRRGFVRAGRDAASPAVFVAGYLLVWLGFSVAAAVAQGALANALLLSPALRLASTPLTALLLGVAGAYQITPLKRACLSRCRSPIAFLQAHWRDRAVGVLGMGARHGLSCLGCCWALMLLLFAGGIMNLVWVALLTAVVLVEKVLPGGAGARRWIGAALLLAAAAVLVV